MIVIYAMYITVHGLDLHLVVDVLGLLTFECTGRYANDHIQPVELPWYIHVV